MKYILEVYLIFSLLAGYKLQSSNDFKTAVINAFHTGVVVSCLYYLYTLVC